MVIPVREKGCVGGGSVGQRKQQLAVDIQRLPLVDDPNDQNLLLVAPEARLQLKLNRNQSDATTFGQERCTGPLDSTFVTKTQPPATAALMLKAVDLYGKSCSKSLNVIHDLLSRVSLRSTCRGYL